MERYSELPFVGDATGEELDLIRSGDIYLLQRYRYVTFANRVASKRSLREKKEESAKESNNLNIVQDLQEELSTLSKEYWILERLWGRIRISITGVPSPKDTCTEYFGKILLGEEAGVAETVDAVLIARPNSQLAIASWSVFVARKPGGLHLTPSKNPSSRTSSSLITTVSVDGITTE
ncbi:hypothetical protein N7457_006141 [Penicillium paradoxum]|uniref:uncharacterized protein n=1 Tax=Penicillium paradoxum TaxID=176176 RepID=UPI002547856F|nr:uncharacterized protein N7457_006141 [Penicillium paradoxum]KAJ5780981.1 hypothetical protein N7457_006141 [Penicillium paradoxum]